ncbi:MAG: hypothetical protein FWF99_02280 [Desulfovibrionaceae bacterium]|nr:hypothetical protein [Desulfovibrionaceae bacterium]
MEKLVLSEILPHQRGMILLSRVLDYDCERGLLTAEYDVDERCLFYDPGIGGIYAWVSFECMAQAISALSGLTEREKGLKPRVGFILSVNGLELRRPVLPAGSTIRISVSEDYKADQIFNFHAQASLADEVVAVARLSVMELDENLAVLEDL